MLGLDISSLLRKLHTWFKVSTARREDMAAIFALLEEIDSFYLRLVDTRWLSMEPALERFLKHEGSTSREYFFNFIPNSKDQCNLNVKRTDTCKEIVHFLKPANHVLCQICFVLG